MYEREVTEQQEKVGRMRQEGSDEADIHKQVRSPPPPIIIIIGVWSLRRSGVCRWRSLKSRAT
jgi:hypothetical protein